MDELSVQELSDEDLAKLAALSGISEEEAMLAKQLQQAQMLQQRQGPQMRGNGRVQTAANPLEFVGAGLQQYAGMRREKELMGKMDELRKQQMQGRQLYMNRMMDSPYRRSTQPFIQGVGDPAVNVPMPAMSF